MTFKGMLIGGRAPGRWVESDSPFYRVYVSRSMPVRGDIFPPSPLYATNDVSVDSYSHEVFKYKDADGGDREFAYFRHSSLKDDAAVLEHLFQNYHPTISGAF